MSRASAPTRNYLEPLCYQRPTDNSPHGPVLLDSDDVDETRPSVGPLTLRATGYPNNVNATKRPPLAAPSTLPEYAAEVGPLC